jgi:hypothetical protein
MAQEQNVTVEVQPSDTINSLIERLVASGGRSINLVVPQSAPVPSTLPEFEQLRELERRAGLRLTLVVDARDRTRYGLAKILSFNVRTSEAAPMPAVEANYVPPAPIAPPPATPSSSQLAEPPMLPDNTDLPPDIAEMNFDEGEPDTSQPPAPATAIPTAGPNRPHPIDSDAAPPLPRSSGRTAAVRLAHLIGSDAAPPPPPAQERDHRADWPHTEQRDLAPNALTTSSKVKIKSKTSSGAISPDASGAPLAPLALADVDDNDAAALAAPATTRRSPGESKTAAAATLAAPPRIMSGTGRPATRPDAETLRRRRERSRLAIFVALAALLVIGLGAGGYLLFNLGGTPPGANVALTPRTVAVSQRVSVPIALNGQARLDSFAEADYRANPSSRQLAPVSTPATITATLPPLPDSATAAPVTAQPISATVTESGTVNTTGHRDEPRGNDSTTLKIVNTSEAAATLPAGTLVSARGYSFALPTAVVVPGSNLLAGSIGTTYAKVTATAVGPTGVAAFTMVGSLGALRYENTDSAKGGYIERIPTVSEADYNNLVGGLIAKVNARIPDEINAQLGARVLITPTFGYNGDLQVVTDHKVGEDGSSLAATVAHTAHEYAFDPKDASAAAIVAVQQSITSFAKNVKLDPNSIKVNQGQLQPAANGYVYEAAASASATYIVDQATSDGVRQMLAGHKVNESASDLRQLILARYPTLADVQIQLLPGSGNNDGILTTQNITVKPAVGSASGTPAPATATAAP